MAWKDLTERQKQLDRKLDATGIKLENTKDCLSKVMKAIGAGTDEADFVLSRIQLRLRTQQMLNETDSLIGQIEGKLNKFEQEDKESEQILQSLGIKFPKNREIN